MTTFDLGLLGFSWAGEYNAANEYKKNQWVMHQGSVYVYINDSPATGILPTVETHWGLALPGQDGVLSDADIKTQYLNNPDTNNFDDASMNKLQSIDASHYGAALQNTTELAAIPEAENIDKVRRYIEDEECDYFFDEQATSGDVAPNDQTGGTGFWKKLSVGGETAAQLKAKYESNPDTNGFTNQLKTKVEGVEANATADQSPSEIKTAFDSLVPRISAAEISDGSETDVRQFSPSDITEISLNQSGGGTSELLHIQDQKASGTNGGTFTSGADRIRTLNTVLTNEITGASVSSNQITLPAGMYDIVCNVPAYKSNSHQAILFNLTDLAISIFGTDEYSASGAGVMSKSLIRGRITITETKVFEIRHRCATTSTTFGFGVANSFGRTAIYTDVLIKKVA